MNKKAIILLILLAAIVPSWGQKIVPSPAELYSDALEFMFSEDYNDALLILLNLQDNGFTTPNTSFKIGECYLNIQGHKTRAIPYLKEAAAEVSSSYNGNTIEEEFAPNKALFYLGIAYRLNNDFDNALLYLNKYLEMLDDVDKENRSITEYQIERCYYARELMAAPAKFFTDTLPDHINSATSNFNTLVTYDEKQLYYMRKLKFYDAVMHAVKADTLWQPPLNLTPEIKSDGDHYLTGMSSDGAQLFLTSYDPYRSGEIYTTELKNGQWSELRKLNKHINTLFNESHATLSSNGKYLYFTSDRKGGYGGLDIYRSARDNSGDWGPPVNMGPLINSPYNEESPFESSDAGKLYFSSQGHYNMGGYDVFFSEANEDSSWLPPLNLGYPLNTTDDDLFFFPLGDGHVGYQARYSPLNGRMDIIRFTISKFGDPARFMVNGKVDLHAGPDYDPTNVSVTFIDKIAEDTVAIKHLNEDGSFRQKLRGGTYALYFQDDNLSLLTKDLFIPDYFPHNNLVFHEELTIPSRILSDTLFIRNIRFDFNKSGFSEDYCPFLDGIAEALIRYPDMELNVNGYADALGGSNYNLKLSMLRANSVAEYIKSKLTLPAKISVDAYGELNPVAVNSNPDGTDNIMGRSFNRRVELVLSNLPGHVIVVPVNEVPEKLRQK